MEKEKEKKSTSKTSTSSKWIDFDWDMYVKMKKWEAEQPMVFGRCAPDDNEYTRFIKYVDDQERRSKNPCQN